MKLLVMLALVLSVFTLSQTASAQHHGKPGHHGGWERDYVRCDSNGYNYRECGSYKVRRIERARLVQQHSKTTCYQGRNWGYNRANIWVNGGCRATFEVVGR